MAKSKSKGKVSVEACDLLVRNAYVLTMDPRRRKLKNGAIENGGAIIPH